MHDLMYTLNCYCYFYHLLYQCYRHRYPPTSLSKVLEYGSVSCIRDAARLSTRYKVVGSITVEVPKQPHCTLVAQGTGHA